MDDKSEEKAVKWWVTAGFKISSGARRRTAAPFCRDKHHVLMCIKAYTVGFTMCENRPFAPQRSASLHMEHRFHMHSNTDVKTRFFWIISLLLTKAVRCINKAAVFVKTRRTTGKYGAHILTVFMKKHRMGESRNISKEGTDYSTVMEGLFALQHDWTKVLQCVNKTYKQFILCVFLFFK